MEAPLETTLQNTGSLSQLTPASVSLEGPCSTKACSRRPASAHRELEDDLAPSLPLALSRCPGQKHSPDTPHSCTEQWQNKVPHLPLGPMLSSPKGPRSSLPFPSSPGQAVFDLTYWKLSWASLMWIRAPQQLASEGQVRRFFPWAATLSLMLFPLWEANKAAIPTLLRKADAESQWLYSALSLLHTSLALWCPRIPYSQGSSLSSCQPRQEEQMSFTLCIRKQYGKVYVASSLWNASYEAFCRDSSLKSHLLAFKELYSRHASTTAHKQEKEK